MKFIKTLIVVFLFFSSDIFSQGQTISGSSNCFQMVTGTVKNKVTNENIQNATVELYSQNRLIETLQTNNKGAFRFKVDCDASYQLVSFKGDLTKTKKDFVTSDAGNIRVMFTLLIEEPEKLIKQEECKVIVEGIVKNDEDEFLKEAVVIVYEKGAEINRTIVKSGSTYQFILECNKSYKLIAQGVNHIEYGFVLNTGSNNNNTFEKNFRLEKLACIKDLFGELIDANTKEKIEGVSIDLLLNGNTINTTKTDNQGKYFFKKVKCNDNYSMVASKNGYQKSIFRIAKIEYNGPAQGYFSKVTLIPIPKEVVVEEIEEEVVEEVVEEVIVEKVEVEPTIEERSGLKVLDVGEIEFDLNESKITRSIAIELDKIVVLMMVKPTINVQLKSHTDSRGPDTYNINLTEARAQSMVNYIVSNGIDSNRITGKGYGETELTNECSNDIKCNEAAHQKNRRNEFIITNE